MFGVRRVFYGDSKTIFIPKINDASDTGKFRRIFQCLHSFANRVDHLNNYNNQLGFHHFDGANIKNLNIGFMDLKKAFYSSHAMLRGNVS